MQQEFYELLTGYLSACNCESPVGKGNMMVDFQWD